MPSFGHRNVVVAIAKTAVIATEQGHSEFAVRNPL
jgi:hypothetical protein